MDGRREWDGLTAERERWEADTLRPQTIQLVHGAQHGQARDRVVDPDLAEQAVQ